LQSKDIALRTLYLLLFLAVTLRIGSAIYQGNAVHALPGVADQISYHELALRVLAGHGFSFGTGWWPATEAGQPTAHWSFLYTAYLSAVYLLFGPNPFAARLIQSAVTGILQPLLAWRIGRRLFGHKVGLVSAGLTAVYAYFVFYGGALMTESFYIVAILWTFDLATSFTAGPDPDSRHARLLPWLQLGVAFALAALLRQVFLILVPVILIWILWRLDRRPGSLSIPKILCRCAGTLSVLCLCIAPWTLRNYRVFHTSVLLNTNSGFAFYWGNHPIHGKEFTPLLPADTYASLIPLELRGRSEAEMDKELLRRGFAFVRADPMRYLLLSMSRAKEYFKFWPTSDSGAMSNFSRALSSGIYLPLIFLGCAYVLFQPHRHNRVDDTNPRPINPGASLLVLWGIAYTGLHLMSWTLIRYRLPVDAAGIPFAAVALVFGYGRLKEMVRTLAFDASKLDTDHSAQLK
jgi:hypothetical protein